MKVGWIGLGAMGLPMASCLAQAGHYVAGYDVDESRMAGLVAAEGRAVRSAAEAALGAEVLVLMVATPAQVEAVLFGEGAAAAGLRTGAIVLVMATVGPAEVRSLADRLATAGITVVDAPVSGGTARAATGDLLVMVGGAPEAVERLRPLLDAMAGKWTLVGPNPGDGQNLKMVNQLLCGVHIAAAAEALALAEALGLDPAASWEVVRHGAGESFMLNDRGARMVSGSFDQVKSALDIFVKDMGLVVDVARQHSFPAPLAATAEQLYMSGHRAGLGRLDDSAVIQVLLGRPLAPEVKGTA
jgi:3-hydroxyisobutyrate dehydrogenase